jgi:hypothetical protein
VDFVNEQDVAVFEIREERRKVARFRDNRTRRRAETDAHFLGDNLRERGLAKPGRTKEKHMVKRLPAPLGRLDKHPQIVTRRRLPDKFAERFRPQCGVDVFGPFVGRGQAVVCTHPIISS